MDHTYLTKNITVRDLVTDFCHKKLDNKQLTVALYRISQLEEAGLQNKMNSSPRLWAATIIYLTLKENHYDIKFKQFNLTQKDINVYFGVRKNATTVLEKRLSGIKVQQDSRSFAVRSQLSSKHRQRIYNSNNNRKPSNKIKIGINSPEAFKAVRAVTSIAPIKEKKYIKYPVLYGTNRLQDKLAQFSNKRDDKIHFGYCEVSIPESHKMGNLEKQNWFQKLIFEESPNKYFTVLTNDILEEHDFIESIKQKVGESDEKDVLLFIHGYNVKFNDAIKRTAQLGFDLSFKGAVTAFSWPSIGTVAGYISDTDSARFSSTYLSQFIKLITNENVKKLHIIAHSMGNVVLTQSLIQLKEENFLPNLIINQIILAAPDIDKDVFITQIMPSINDIGRLTLYASNKDKALIASRKIRNNYSRLGEGGAKIVVIDGIDSIDASKVDTSLLGHGYFSDTYALLSDIHMVLQGLSPSRRILDEKNKTINGINKTYWAFKNS